jgi:pimeloyl-ACP methyl ester carboxylesterase
MDEMPALTTQDGRTLAWRELGSGPLLLCHPGGPGCSAAYFADLPELAAQRTLLLLDPRGTGASDRPADRSAYALEDYAADIEALREHLGRERLDVLGHSHGGFVAMTWAGRHPEHVGRLVLAATAPRFTDVIRGRRIERVASHQNEPYFADAIAALGEQQSGNYADDAELAALYERASVVLGPLGEDTASIAAAFRVAGTNADATRHFNDHIAGEMDLRPLLARIEAPTLVITGDRDAFGGPTVDEIAGALPNPTVVHLPGADHFAHLEPQTRGPWSRAVLAFLGA